MIRRTRMGHYVVVEDCALAHIVEGFCTFEYPDNLADLVFVSDLIPEGGVVIDAGACIGDQTVIYSQMVGATGLVHAFEPHPDSYAALVKNTARLRNVVTYPAGLSDRREAAGLSCTPNIGASFVGTDADQWPQVPVILMSLDALDLPRCDFIHLDAEGMETTILKGAHKLIERCYPNLMVEVCDDWLRRYGSSEADLLTLLRDWSYHLQSRKGVGGQYDVVASRQILDTLPDVPHTQAVSA